MAEFPFDIVGVGNGYCRIVGLTLMARYIGVDISGGGGNCGIDVGGGDITVGDEYCGVEDCDVAIGNGYCGADGCDNDDGSGGELCEFDDNNNGKDEE